MAQRGLPTRGCWWAQIAAPRFGNFCRISALNSAASIFNHVMGTEEIDACGDVRMAASCLRKTIKSPIPVHLRKNLLGGAGNCMSSGRLPGHTADAKPRQDGDVAEMWENNRNGEK